VSPPPPPPPKRRDSFLLHPGKVHQHERELLPPPILADQEVENRSLAFAGLASPQFLFFFLFPFPRAVPAAGLAAAVPDRQALMPVL
jgi:hypothetical protein